MRPHDQRHLGRRLADTLPRSLRGRPKSRRGGGFAAAHFRARRAGYGPPLRPQGCCASRWRATAPRGGGCAQGPGTRGRQMNWRLVPRRRKITGTAARP